jgi:hypothetical protein
MRTHHTANTPQVDNVLTDLDRFAATLATPDAATGLMPDYDAGYARAVKHLTQKLATIRAEYAA